ncbi:MAG: hypothetical protein HY782_17165 [Chloroflexi bacterium]|nr:hypothetical protein [Chloroflexota bacterium]
MKQLLIAAIVMLALSVVACAQFDSSTSERERISKAFLDAVLAGNETEAVKSFVDTSVDGTLTRILHQVIITTSRFDFTNLEVSSKVAGTPTPAEKANGVGQSYWYHVRFAYREKNTTRPWRDGNWRFEASPVNSRWIVTNIAFCTDITVCQ